jgi:hypothetical protein
LFINGTSNWNETEIGIVDDAFKSMVDKVGNVQLLKDSTSSAPLNFKKYADLNGASGSNYLQRSSQSTYVNGQWVTTHTYTREIRIAEWDETVAYLNRFYLETVTHELGHNWDESFELDTLGLGGKIADFLGLSGWTANNPNSSDYARSGDGQWWYLKSASFAQEYGKTNPYEDWGTAWSAYFDASLSPAVADQLAAKFQIFDSIVAVL